MSNNEISLYQPVELDLPDLLAADAGVPVWLDQERASLFAEAEVGPLLATALAYRYGPTAAIPEVVEATRAWGGELDAEQQRTVAGYVDQLLEAAWLTVDACDGESSAAWALAIQRDDLEALADFLCAAGQSGTLIERLRRLDEALRSVVPVEMPPCPDAALAKRLEASALYPDAWWASGWGA